MIYTGCHLSSSKGFEAMGKNALKLGADTFAFFTRNPRGGNAKAIDPDDAARFRKLAEEHRFGKLVAHAPYTLNPCAAKAEVRDFAFRAFQEDLERMEYIPGNYYNFHPGSHVGQGGRKRDRAHCRASESVFERRAEHHSASGNHGGKRNRGWPEF